MNTEKYYNDICTILDREKSHILNNTSSGLTDQNIHWEKIAARILSWIFSWDLYNLNAKQINYPGIDLGDSVRGIGVQVTSDKTSSKMNNTLEKINNPRLLTAKP